MRRLVVSIAVVVVVCGATVVFADGFRRIREFLTGFEEVPVVSTQADGEFTAKINHSATQIEYELSYEDLQGSVQQAHIHLGQKGVNGGISVWLCGNPQVGPPAINPPAGTQLCPPSPATIRGTITAANVVGPSGQGIAAGEFAELLRAMRAGQTYVNVHSNLFPGGEIRSQIDLRGRDHH
jgi:CHRD domain